MPDQQKKEQPVKSDTEAGQNEHEEHSIPEQPSKGPVDGETAGQTDLTTDENIEGDDKKRIDDAGRQRASSSSAVGHTGVANEKQGRRPDPSLSVGRLSELKRFTLWETRTHFYLVAYNTSQTLFRILKIGRIPETKRAKQANDANNAQSTGAEHASASTKLDDGPTDANHQFTDWTLTVTADRVVYTRTQMSNLLDMISEGNRATGGLKEIGRFFGIVGFIRFTSTYYMVLISRRSVVALLGGHYIYHCDETKIIPVCPSNVLANIGGRTKALDQEEARLLHTFKQVDLSKNFYFSYTYDLTKTLQDNLTQPVNSAHESSSVGQTAWGYNEKFVWNHHLLLPAFAASQNDTGAADEPANEWVLPLVYGFVDQAKLRVLNCTIHVTLIARRSRHFAGARFLKRGTDELGHVANDVETEQIVSDALTTPFYAPERRRYGDDDKPTHDKQARGPNPRYTSYVMHRGSIPIFWTQDSTNMSPRPPIEISVVDPYYSSAALHFDDMLRRYGHPVIILNLIKSKEKQPREVKLLNAFGECVQYLNQFLPADKRLRYIAWDMSRASKSRDQDVIGVLEDIAEETINATKFFHSGPEPTKFAFEVDRNGRRRQVRETILVQSGVARVNCVDCLDRTNAAQFVIGKAALGHQLYALGLLSHPSLPFDSDAIDMLTEMYHDLGDTIALQYGGSHLVNTMETYRKINQWTSHSRDMLEGLKRYYSNSFVDAEKQAAINIFLGVDNDTPDFRPIDPRKRRHYQHWFTSDHLKREDSVVKSQHRLEKVVEGASSFWAEYYRPSLFTDLMRHHAFKMTAIHQHAPLPNRIPSSSAASPPMASPASKASSLLTLHHASTPVQSETSLSPFMSRIALPPSKAHPNTTSDASPSMGSPRSSQQQGAIIGGVRRWMSLNRGDESEHLLPGSSTVDAPASGSRKVSKKHTIDLYAENGDTEQRIKEGLVSTTTSGMSAWPTWDELVGANAGAPTIEALTNSLLSPVVSAEEAKEYASWLNQFRNVSFDVGPQGVVLEPAALLSANHVQHPQTESSLFEQDVNARHSGAAGKRLPSAVLTDTANAGGDARTVATLAPSALVAPRYTQTISARRPATQKQRQQVAEADARLYDHEVALASGRLDHPQGGKRSGRESGGGGDSMHNVSMLYPDSVDPILLQYASTADALQQPVSDAKVQRFTRWLHGHQQPSVEPRDHGSWPIAFM